MKGLKFLGIILIIFLINGCSNSNLEKISYKEYMTLINNKETFILEVMRNDCSACTSLKPRLEEVAKEYNIEIKYIDTSSLNEDEYNKFSDMVYVKGTPTIIFYENGEEQSMATRIVGAVPKDKLITKFKDMGYIK